MYQLPHTGAVYTMDSRWYGERSSRHPWTPLHRNGLRNLRPRKIPGLHGNSWWKNAGDKMQLTIGYCLQLELSPSVQTAGEYYTAISTYYHSRSTLLSCRRRTTHSPVTIMLCHPSFVCRGCLMEYRYQKHLPLTWTRLMFLTIYWDIGWGSSPTCTPRWKSNSLQGREEGDRVLVSYE